MMNLLYWSDTEQSLDGADSVDLQRTLEAATDLDVIQARARCSMSWVAGSTRSRRSG